MNNNPIYQITNNTLALITAKSTTFSTIAIETTTCHFLTETPLEIIQAACEKNYTTYQTIRNIIRKQTGFKKKTPIPIHLQTGLTIFPTHAITHYDCSWIVYSNRLHHTYHHNITTLHLNSYQQLNLSLSPHILRKQITRAFEIQFGVRQQALSKE